MTKISNHGSICDNSQLREDETKSINSSISENP